MAVMTDNTTTKEAKPTAEWRSPTMLSPEEIEDLRRDAQESSKRMKAILAARKAAQQSAVPPDAVENEKPC